MSIYKTILARRTIRRFKQRAIPKVVLRKLVNAARLAPSAANLQPLEFIVVKNKNITAKIFPHLKWAGYIALYATPSQPQRPVVFIIVLVNKAKAVLKYAAYDVGAAAQNIILSAWECGIGACWMQAIKRDKIKKILNIDKNYRLDSVISLGYREEKPVVEDFKSSVKYWKDKKGILHVPKRSIKQICKFV